MKIPTKLTALALGLAVALPGTGCFGRGSGPILAAMAGTAIVTAAIVSAHQPPPPRVVYVPPPRYGYVWQPGYWTLEGRTWVWVEGAWVAERPGHRWERTYWAQAPDGSWHLIRGHWAYAG